MGASDALQVPFLKPHLVGGRGNWVKAGGAPASGAFLGKVPTLGAV